jgi:hypothetical protein
VESQSAFHSPRAVSSLQITAGPPAALQAPVLACHRQVPHRQALYGLASDRWAVERPTQACWLLQTAAEIDQPLASNRRWCGTASGQGRRCLEPLPACHRWLHGSGGGLVGAGCAAACGRAALRKRAAHGHRERRADQPTTIAQAGSMLASSSRVSPGWGWLCRSSQKGARSARARSR